MPACVDCAHFDMRSAGPEIARQGMGYSWQFEACANAIREAFKP